jgi:ribosomal protein S27E
MPWPSDDDSEEWSQQCPWPNDVARASELRRMKATPKRTRRDSGGWSMRGMEVMCPKCNEVGPMIETTIYGKTKRLHFCNTCAKDWVSYDEHEPEEDDDRI